ncbi:MAG TPA: hypothetical protein ENI80_00720 [Acidiferrobacteraceae bacterium]|nr:hypothetical protein [Acidiferrobacteraceae bacterium]
MRTTIDEAPMWQCPKCQAAYAKTDRSQDPVSQLHYRRQPTGLLRLQRFLSSIFLISLVVTALAYFYKGDLTAPTPIHPDLLSEPIQQLLTNSQDFSVLYKREKYNVRPVADYELWGLVVSHNNISGLMDSYHDGDSVDTKDLCVVWGGNLTSGSYQQAKYTSGAWTCYYTHPYGVSFNSSQFSNNHLITADQAIRDIIAEIRIGDQVHVKGQLVDYQADKFPDFWRKSSTTRADSGNKACEVVFVSKIDILRKGTAGWYAAFTIGLWTMLVVFLLKGVVLYLEGNEKRH